MSDEYLWNREGEPDEQVLQLEKLLGQLHYRSEKRPRRPARYWMAAAAILLCALSIPYFLWRRGPLTDWQLADGHRLRAGQMVETDETAAASIEAQFTGHVDIEPHSRLRLVGSNPDHQRFHLERGTIHALIWAPPGRFVVDTPSAKTVDLGCRYTLQVSADGTGIVTVETGWVAFEWQQREAFIPAGASCITRPRRGPGTPWFSDAPQTLKTALADFDTTGSTSAYRVALNSARQRDALTVWHLMVRTRGQQRGEAFDRLQQVAVLPATLTRNAVLRGEPAALDAAWNALNLGSTDWWREWKRP